MALRSVDFANEDNEASTSWAVWPCPLATAIKENPSLKVVRLLRGIAFVGLFSNSILSFFIVFSNGSKSNKKSVRGLAPDFPSKKSLLPFLLPPWAHHSIPCPVQDSASPVLGMKLGHTGSIHWLGNQHLQAGNQRPFSLKDLTSSVGFSGVFPWLFSPPPQYGSFKSNPSFSSMTGIYCPVHP